MFKYTEKEHAKNLIKYFESGVKVCNLCPLTYKLFPLSAVSPKNTECKVCAEFVGLPPIRSSIHKERYLPNCPCNNFGKEAIKVTWLALEEKGYV